MRGEQTQKTISLSNITSTSACGAQMGPSPDLNLYLEACARGVFLIAFLFFPAL